MKVIVQCCKTWKYLAWGETWVESADEARVFLTSAIAVSHIVTSNLIDVQVILKFQNSSMDVKLPILGATSCAEA